MSRDTTEPRRLSQVLNGEVVDNSNMAIELAEVLIRRIVGDECLKIQKPLLVHDGGKYWAIEGAPNASDEATGLGPVRIEIKKGDASVASLCFALSSALASKFKEGGPPRG